MFGFSNPKLSPELSGLFITLKLELHGDDVLETLGESGLLEAASKVTECDAR